MRAHLAAAENLWKQGDHDEAATAIADTDDKVSKRIGLRVTKRYCRANLAITANDGTDVVACVALLGGNRYLPES